MGLALCVLALVVVFGGFLHWFTDVLPYRAKRAAKEHARALTIVSEKMVPPRDASPSGARFPDRLIVLSDKSRWLVNWCGLVEGPDGGSAPELVRDRILEILWERTDRKRRERAARAFAEAERADPIPSYEVPPTPPPIRSVSLFGPTHVRERPTAPKPAVTPTGQRTHAAPR